MRSERLEYEPLSIAHAPLLHAALSSREVNEHIGGQAPTLEDLTADFASRAAGPPADRATEKWLNYAVILTTVVDRPYIGRLEASLYGDWAEVAYLFSAQYWGQGYALEAMRWWHLLLKAAGARELWAAVTPANARSLALLARLGYAEIPVENARPLASYDAGDRLFRLDLPH